MANTSDVEVREKCVFCRIYDGKEPTTELFKDEKYMVFPDIKPVAKNHFLVIPKEHIPDAKHVKSADQEIIEDLVRVGKQVLEEKGGNLTDCLLGFHWPPFNSVSHLHLHVISPASEMSFMSKVVFKANSYWFVTPEYVRGRL